MDKEISLRDYINNKNNIRTIHVPTFCYLMKMVEDAINEQTGFLIKINLDDIKINIETGNIILPDVFSEYDLDKTMASFNTGVSLIAERKSSLEHQKVSFALMILGFYCNPDYSAVINDLTVLENFDDYMQKVPPFLQGYFVEVFKKMNYELTFKEYYEKNFTEVIQKKIADAFSSYGLNEEQFAKIAALVIKKTDRLLEEGEAYA